ncbi:hypothetical protein Bca52824_013820 [Brassica carinata]|uniref:Uncharacterized protein n=1 Tax=Brassica carinata TaxID=52824 RepID=A0A8X8B482_BRACI|nr:hypothetical protein Bca52824_013820 [Brassica carinata]
MVKPSLMQSKPLYVEKPLLSDSSTSSVTGRTVPRMSVKELDEGKQWLDDTFTLIRCELDSHPNIGWVLERAKAAVLRHGIRGLVTMSLIIIHQRTSRQNCDEKAGPLDLVQICVKKVRNRVAEQIGDAYLCYDRATGLYSDSPITPEKPERRSNRRPCSQFGELTDS